MKIHSTNLALAMTFLLANASLAEVRSIPAEEVGYYISENVVMIAATPDVVWDNLTGDVLPWWDHSWSENPLKMYIEPTPGGGFYEIFDKEGHGVRHAAVIAAVPGKLLRLDGPLGLAGRAIDTVTTYELEASGDSTKVIITCSFGGQIGNELAKTVDLVQRHFIAQQLKTFIESGAYLEK